MIDWIFFQKCLWNIFKKSVLWLIFFSSFKAKYKFNDIFVKFNFFNWNAFLLNLLNLHKICSQGQLSNNKKKKQKDLMFFNSFSSASTSPSRHKTSQSGQRYLGKNGTKFSLYFFFIYFNLIDLVNKFD